MTNPITLADLDQDALAEMSKLVHDFQAEKATLIVDFVKKYIRVKSEVNVEVTVDVVLDGDGQENLTLSPKSIVTLSYTPERLTNEVEDIIEQVRRAKFNQMFEELFFQL